MKDFDKSRSAGYLANHQARLFAQALAERINPMGLAPAQFQCLLELWREDGLTQRDLVQRLDVEQATMANTLKRMERDGLIERRAHAGDARARTIHLTERARDLQGPAQAEAQAVNARATAEMSDEERTAFLDLMTRAVDALRK
ncbi:MarR family winged helix-turn-helix transcriptional regulator [Salipiger bermudensis]|uniref:Transcriptional regulator n=1 Tax=Salipiger bermudensis (strain DSM 26914 / JCM 13377 / KCTC 12554 / HTCC2601) TaxID=314265 RepID=Q0FK00_SALBH|nr:MarR family transcriptional regulator [Salipiger bermudensis]EAU44526.1 transcriptional regulator [Salipiger bermudensis HTCC2601]MBN9676246.1 MarR family transcriptional regulator [Salipiger bermudensis]MCA1285449.1 MarR family transcriptional regulator [Salipiger bermudensis]